MALFFFFFFFFFLFFFQAEDGIRDLVRSRGLGDVYKRQPWNGVWQSMKIAAAAEAHEVNVACHNFYGHLCTICLLYTSDAADERSSVDLGGRRIIKKKNTNKHVKSA